MPIDISKLNPRGKLKHLIANDLFAEGVQQLFSPTTGELIGMVKDGKEIFFNANGEAETIPQPPPAPEQLSLF